MKKRNFSGKSPYFRTLQVKRAPMSDASRQKWGTFSNASAQTGQFFGLYASTSQCTKSWIIKSTTDSFPRIRSIFDQTGQFRTEDVPTTCCFDKITNQRNFVRSKIRFHRENVKGGICYAWQGKLTPNAEIYTKCGNFECLRYSNRWEFYYIIAFDIECSLKCLVRSQGCNFVLNNDS